MTLLHLVSVSIDIDALGRFAGNRERGLIAAHRNGQLRSATLDEGRALHHLLDETFGPSVLRPFRMMVSPRKVHGTLYAYSRHDRVRLLDDAQTTGMPEAQRVLGMADLATRPVHLLQVDRTVDFDVRIRPVVRIHSELPDPRGREAYKRGAELDAFFVEAQRTFPNERPRLVDGRREASGMERAERTREVVYRDWLAKRLAPSATLVRADLKHMERRRVSRADHESEGPDAVFHGTLKVDDPQAFHALLAHGVGRHRSYGYGMLLLRPTRRPAEERF